MIELIQKGKYKVTVDIGFVNGKRKRTSKIIYGTKQVAKELECKINKEKQNGSYLPYEKLTFNDVSRMFIEDYCKKNLSKNTVDNYENLLIRINQELGNIDIKKINAYTLQKFYNYLKEENLSGVSIDHYYKLINNIFEHSIKWQLVAENPNRFIEKIKKEKKEVKVYSQKDVNCLMKALENEPIEIQTPIVLCLDTGMRREELNGLTWNDIDFENKTISINQVRLYTGKKIIVAPPKTESSKRKIYITDYSQKLLKKLKEQQNFYKKKVNCWEDTDFVFVNELGIPYFPDRLSKMFKSVLKRYRLPDLTFHALRHTNASLLINQTEDIKLVSSRLGHSQISTTLNIYTHKIEQKEKELIDKMNSILADS